MALSKDELWKVMKEPGHKHCDNCAFSTKNNHPANYDEGGNITCQPDPCWDINTNIYRAWKYDGKNT